MLSLFELIGFPGNDVVLEGADVAEFLERLQSLPSKQNLDYGKLRRAVRITGTDRLGEKIARDGEGFGYACGRNWFAEYPAAARRELRFPPHLMLLLSHNDHKAARMCVAEHCVCCGVDDLEWVSEDQRHKAYEVDELWELRWYPDTPVGFCRKLAADLGVLLAWVEKNYGAEGAAPSRDKAANGRAPVADCGS